MNPFFYIASAFTGGSVALSVVYLMRMLDKAERETLPPSSTSAEGNRILAMIEGLPLVRQFTLLRKASSKHLLPKMWRGRILQHWELSGRAKREHVYYVARLEAVLLLSFFSLFLPLLFLFGFVGAFFTASTYSLLVGFSIYYSFKNQVAGRLRSIDRELPYALDLLSMMLAGGGNVFNSLEVLVQIRSRSALMQELRIVTSSLYGGNTFIDALRDFADRVDLENVRSIVLAIEQGQRLGTPLHQILKSHSSTIRNKRVLAAEELAHTAGTKVFIPASLVMLALVIIMLAPSIIKMFDAR